MKSQPLFNPISRPLSKPTKGLNHQLRERCYNLHQQLSHQQAHQHLSHQLKQAECQVILLKRQSIKLQQHHQDLQIDNVVTRHAQLKERLHKLKLSLAHKTDMLKDSCKERELVEQELQGLQQKYDERKVLRRKRMMAEKERQEMLTLQARLSNEAQR